MKIEIVITVWDDGLFKMRNRVDFDYDGADYPNIEDIIDKMVSKIVEKKNIEDDDIPF